MKPKLIIFRGVPGTGKSTKAREYAQKHNIHHFEADMFFERNGKYDFDPSKLNAAHSWCRHKVKSELARGRSVVVSNTFTQYWELESYLADAFMIGDVSVEIYHCKKEYGNVHNVPEEKMKVMRGRFVSNDDLKQKLGVDKSDTSIKFFEVE